MEPNQGQGIRFDRNPLQIPAEVFRMLLGNGNPDPPILHNRCCGDVSIPYIPQEDIFRARPLEKLFIIKGRRNANDHLIPAPSGQETEYELRSFRGKIVARLVKQPLAQTKENVGNYGFGKETGNAYRGYDSDGNLLFNISLRTNDGNDCVFQTLRFQSSVDNSSMGFLLKKSDSPNLAFMNSEKKVIGIIRTDLAKRPKNPHAQWNCSQIKFSLDSILKNSTVPIMADYCLTETESMKVLQNFDANFEFNFTETMEMSAKGMMIGTLIFSYQKLYSEARRAQWRSGINPREQIPPTRFDAFLLRQQQLARHHRQQHGHQRQLQPIAAAPANPPANE